MIRQGRGGGEGRVKTRSPFVHALQMERKGAGVNALKNNHIGLNGLDRQD